MKFTNKKLLAAAVLTAITAQANAATVTYEVTSSDISMDVYFGGGWIGASSYTEGPGTSSQDDDVAPYDDEAPFTTSGFNISGTVDFDDQTGNVVSQDLVFDGGLVVNTSGPDYYIGFMNVTGDYVVNQGLTLNSGAFDGGTGGGADMAAYIVIDASTALPFTEGGVVNVAPSYVNPGFVIDQNSTLNGSPITITMPGFDTGVGFGENAAGGVDLFGFAAHTYFGGSLTMEVAAVPVPAAAWLFGSALVGLAGVGRKRR